MKGKHFAKAYWSKTRIVSVVLSIALLFGCITFSTAWLIAENKEGPVVNEFTGSKLKIELSPDEDQGTYLLIPGKTYELGENEAPKVTVEGGSVECYLFVVFHEVGTIVNGNRKHLDSYISYNYNAGTNWGMLKQLVADGTDENGMPYKDYVFYAKTPENAADLCNYVLASPNNQTFDIMAKNGSGNAYFTVSDQVTKQDVNPHALEANPYITFTAYSIQTLGFKGSTQTGSDAEKYVGDINLAWNEVQDAIDNGNTKEVVLEDK